MPISGMTYVNPKKIKRLNPHLSWLWVWKILNFELPFRIVVVIFKNGLCYAQIIKIVTNWKD